jgi:hypothetical protein
VSLSFAAITRFSADHLKIIAVQTSRCHYRVAVHLGDQEVTVQGPGVEEVYSFDALGPSTLPPEAQAIIACVLLEEE